MNLLAYEFDTSHGTLYVYGGTAIREGDGWCKRVCGAPWAIPKWKRRYDYRRVPRWKVPEPEN